MGSPSADTETVFEFKMYIKDQKKGKKQDGAEEKVTGEADPKKPCPPWPEVPE